MAILDKKLFSGLVARINRFATLGMIAYRFLILGLIALLWSSSWGFSCFTHHSMLFVVGLIIGAGVYLSLLWFTYQWTHPVRVILVLFAWDLLNIMALIIQSGGAQSPFIFLFLFPVLFVFVYAIPYLTNLVTGGTMTAMLLVAAIDLVFPLQPITGPALVFSRALTFQFPILFALLLLALFANYSSLRRQGGLRTVVASLERQLEEANEELTRSFYDLEAALERSHSFERQAQTSRQQLMRSDRFNAAGKLAAGILHDLTNPLSIIISDVEMQLLRNEERPERNREVLKRVLTNAQHLSMLIDNLRLLTKQRGDLVYHPVDMRHLIMRCLSALEPERKRRGIVVDAAFDENAPKILGVESQFEQLIVNLLVNAFEASNHPGGRLLVRTRSGDGMFTVEIEDDGEGIAPEYLDKVFEPFFTTRGSINSLGLGLYSVRTIVEEHNGTVQAASDPGVFTRFTVTLPIRPFGRPPAAGLNGGNG
ncbi:MAG: HAMP domain-containing histidine kinase [Myxococcales bacterium]|nr:HAMP domain-containing histidine kinase [Myxococcales bacterium]